MSTNKLKDFKIFNREELKQIRGGDYEYGGDRCLSDTMCYFDGPGGSLEGGGCYTMQHESQCRCVSFRNGVPYASVPSEYCKR